MNADFALLMAELTIAVVGDVCSALDLVSFVTSWMSQYDLGVFLVATSNQCFLWLRLMALYEVGWSLKSPETAL